MRLPILQHVRARGGQLQPLGIKPRSVRNAGEHGWANLLFLFEVPSVGVRVPDMDEPVVRAAL